jgi:hypothetical protein
MAFHGVNPATLEATDKIGENHLDSCATVTYTPGQPEKALTDAIALIGDYDVTGYALSKTFATDLGNYKENGVDIKIAVDEFVLGKSTEDYFTGLYNYRKKVWNSGALVK